jgi:hypothetical protein
LDSNLIICRRAGFYIVPNKKEWLVLTNYLEQNKNRKQMWNDLLKIKVRFALKDHPVTQDPYPTVALFSFVSSKTFQDLCKLIPETSGLRIC